MSWGAFRKMQKINEYVDLSESFPNFGRPSYV
jgi:hypothetical protein